jgi:hypothetical protein
LAQKKFNPDMEHENTIRFGFRGGVNINKIKGQSYNQAFSYSYLAGAFIQYNFSDYWGLQPEVNFTQVNAELSKDITTIYDDLFLDGTQKKSTLSYIKVPVLLNLNVGTSKRFKLQAGPQLGWLLHQKTDSLSATAQTQLYNKNEFSLLGGFWLQLPVVNLGARYELGLTNINSVDKRETWKNQAIQVFVGISF